MNFLKAVLSTAWLCLCLNFASAQVSGRISDSDHHNIDGATVILIRAKDSVVVKSTLSEPNGSFNFKGVENGSYRIRVTCIGFKNYSGAPFDVAGQPVALPVIILSAAAQNLKQVEVTAYKSYIEQRSTERW